MIPTERLVLSMLSMIYTYVYYVLDNNCKEDILKNADVNFDLNPTEVSRLNILIYFQPK